MAEPTAITRAPDPLAALRESVAAHAAATQANVDAGAAVQQQRTPPPAQPEPTS